MKTKTLLMAALLAVTLVAAAPVAEADNAAQCVLRDRHPPEHCASDCTPLGEPEELFLPPDGDSPLRCHEHE